MCVGGALAAQLAAGEQTLRGERHLQSENTATPGFHTVCPAQGYTKATARPCISRHGQNAFYGQD